MLKKYISQHMRKVHFKEKERGRCEICDKEMNKSNISSHIRSVHFKEKVKCNDCGKELSPYSLQQHKNSHKKQALQEQ